MYTNHSCPRCSTPLPQDRLVGSVVICSCGWTGNKADLDAKKKNPHLKKIVYLVVGLAIGFLVYDGSKWGEVYPQKLIYNLADTLRLTEAPDHARFGEMAAKLNKNKYAVIAYSKAFNKDPKSPKYAGALARALVKTKKYDRATMTYGNFFSFTEGSHEDKRYYAKALSATNFNDDATEWFYKAIRHKPDYFIAAKELIEHLSGSDNHIEALSVLGHYNMVYPKTIKGWKKLAADTKSKYETYTGEFKLEEFKISGMNKYLFAPGHFSEGGETQLFMVDQESEYLTIDTQYLESRGIEFKDLGTADLTATSGKSLNGRKILLPELSVGPFAVKNVRAVACDGCAFLLGKGILKRLNYKQDVNKNSGVKYITLRQ